MSQITEQKAVLEAKSSAYQQEIVEEIADIKQVAKERGGQILIAGGVLAGAYLLYSLFSDSSKKSDKNDSNMKVYKSELLLSSNIQLNIP